VVVNTMKCVKPSYLKSFRKITEYLNSPAKNAFKYFIISHSAINFTIKAINV
jgi:hypothetical protein